MGKVVFITGGGYGIGAAIASKMAELGYAVGIFGRSQDQLLKHANVLIESGYSCEWHVCDVTDWQSIVTAVGTMEEKLGSPTVLVNNAGGWIGDPIETIEPERLRSLAETTVVGTMLFSKAVIAPMRRSGGGFILNIGSTSALGTTRDSAIASAPKAAVDIFTRALSKEVSKYHIKVAIIHPARVNKKIDPSEAEGPTTEGLFKSLSPRQVADIAAFMIEQPQNVLIREVIVTPSDVDM